MIGVDRFLRDLTTSVDFKGFDSATSCRVYGLPFGEGDYLEVREDFFVPLNYSRFFEERSMRDRSEFIEPILL